MTRDEDTAAQALARNMHRIRTEGLDAATDAGIRLLQDPKAPAQAKSATINAMFRASGLFGKQEDEEELEPHEMTSAQLDRAIKKQEEKLRAAAAGKDVDGLFD
ncbi:hypothetical protein [Tranquillimonas alkanivorans]|uniref:Uncharacterized protein n=1 Tax=Tranquillimonas alkanivorans TaxID=441119 RepID=A0A1I5PBT6_9RHOB|nr:hypothetical protein [Tranquillimonas alkanivorans]SFP31584.1 hypothetical protein SAMN04488047_10526 [Tranquillimonas alkanivorans]